MLLGKYSLVAVRIRPSRFGDFEKKAIEQAGFLSFVTLVR